MQRLTLLVLALLAFPAMAADSTVVPKLTPEQEIFLVYKIACVQPAGKLEVAKPTIAKLEASDTIRPMPQAQVDQLFKKGDSVWATRTPSGTKMFIVYNPMGCSLFIHQAEPKALKAEFVRFVEAIRAALPGITIKKADDKPQADSLFSLYIVAPIAQAKVGAGFALSTSEPEAKESPQHLLSFSITSTEQ